MTGAVGWGKDGLCVLNNYELSSSYSDNIPVGLRITHLWLFSYCLLVLGHPIVLPVTWSLWTRMCLQVVEGCAETLPHFF